MFNDLSIQEKAAVIKLGIGSGLRSLLLIEDFYNSISEGGDNASSVLGNRKSSNRDDGNKHNEQRMTIRDWLRGNRKGVNNTLNNMMYVDNGGKPYVNGSVASMDRLPWVPSVNTETGQLNSRPDTYYYDNEGLLHMYPGNHVEPVKRMSEDEIADFFWLMENPNNVGLNQDNGMYYKYRDPNGKDWDVGPGLVIGKAIDDKPYYTKEELDMAAYRYHMDAMDKLAPLYDEKYGSGTFSNIDDRSKLVASDVMYRVGLNGVTPSSWPSMFDAINSGNTAMMLQLSRSKFKDGNNVLNYDNARVKRLGEYLYPGEFEYIFRNSLDPNIRVRKVELKKNGGYLSSTGLEYPFDNSYYPEFNEYKKGGSIHIKPENRGKFTALKKRTGHSASWFKKHGTPALRKMATFALNARKWHHKHPDGGSLFDRWRQYMQNNTIDVPITFNLPEVQITAQAPRPGDINYDKYIANTYDAWKKGDVDINTLPTETRNRVRGYSGTIAALHGIDEATKVAGITAAVPAGIISGISSLPYLYNIFTNPIGQKLTKLLLASEIGGRSVDLSSLAITGKSWNENIGNLTYDITGWNPNNSILGLVAVSFTNPGYMGLEGAKALGKSIAYGVNNKIDDLAFKYGVNKLVENTEYPTHQFDNWTNYKSNVRTRKVIDKVIKDNPNLSYDQKQQLRYAAKNMAYTNNIDRGFGTYQPINDRLDGSDLPGLFYPDRQTRLYEMNIPRYDQWSNTHEIGHIVNDVEPGLFSSKHGIIPEYRYNSEDILGNKNELFSDIFANIYSRRKPYDYLTNNKGQLWSLKNRVDLTNKYKFDKGFYNIIDKKTGKILEDPYLNQYIRELLDVDFDDAGNPIPIFNDRTNRIIHTLDEPLTEINNTRFEFPEEIPGDLLLFDENLIAENEWNHLLFGDNDDFLFTLTENIPILKKDASGDLLDVTATNDFPNEFPVLIKPLAEGADIEKQLSKTGTISRNSLDAYIKKQGKFYQNVMNDVLNSDFPGIDKINYNNFKNAVSKKLPEYKRISLQLYKDYGFQSLGYKYNKNINEFLESINKYGDPDLFEDQIYTIQKYGTLDDATNLELLRSDVYNKRITRLQYVEGINDLYKSMKNRYLDINKFDLSTFTFESPGIKGNTKHYQGNPIGHSRTYTTTDEPDVLHIMESLSDWALSFSNKFTKQLPTADMFDIGLNDEIIPNQKGIEYMNSLNLPLKKHMAENYTSRQILENLKFAALRGLKKMRYPTRETAAKIELYPEREAYFDEFGRDVTKEKLYTIGEENEKELSELRDAYQKKKFELNQQYNNGRPMGFGINWDQYFSSLNSDFAKMGLRINELASIEPKLKPGITKKTVYDYEDILHKYTEFPKLYKKLFKNAEVRTVTDPKGNTWYEVDVPENYRKGKAEILMNLAPYLGLGLSSAALNKKNKKALGGQIKPFSYLPIPEVRY